MYKHIIPVNISADGNLFGGLLKKRNVFEAAGFLLIGFIIFKLLFFALPILIKTVLFVVFVLLPMAIALVGIGDQSVIEAITTFIAYKRRKDILPYNIQVDNAEPETVSFSEMLANKITRKKEDESVYASENPEDAPRTMTKKELKAARKEAQKTGKSAKNIKKNKKKRGKIKAPVNPEDAFIPNPETAMASGAIGGAAATATGQFASQNPVTKKRGRLTKEEKEANKAQVKQMKAEIKAARGKGKQKPPKEAKGSKPSRRNNRNTPQNQPNGIQNQQANVYQNTQMNQMGQPATPVYPNQMGGQQFQQPEYQGGFPGQMPNDPSQSYPPNHMMNNQINNPQNSYPEAQYQQGLNPQFVQLGYQPGIQSGNPVGHQNGYPETQMPYSNADYNNTPYNNGGFGNQNGN